MIRKIQKLVPGSYRSRYRVAAARVLRIGVLAQSNVPEFW